jgi:hypothetical protein
MNDDTRRVLDLLAQGKITVDEAEQLLRAMNASAADAAPSEEPRADRARPRWLRIQIHKPAKDGREAREVNIRVPIAVVKGGMRLGAIIGTFAGERAARRMKERGIDLDLSKIHGDFSNMNGAEFDAFMKSLDEMNMHIDDGESSVVRITCE